MLKCKDSSSDSQSEDSSDSIEDITCGFVQGQVVWIKVKGYSIWPGTVSNFLYSDLHADSAASDQAAPP